jgi:putrescine transport system ATP-binding protein
MKSLGNIRRSFAPWNDPAAKPYFTAVDDLTLHVYQREFFALLGASGCGKSTLLRMLAGFENPTSGKIMLDGQDMSGIPPYKRPVNMMFQSYALFPHMTVENNIAFGLKQDGMAKSEIDDRVQSMLKLVKLTQFPAANASAWRSPAPLPSARKCCFWMNHLARWTKSYAKKPSLN